MKIKLTPELAVYADGLTEVEVKGATPRTGLLRLFNTYPQLYMHLLGPDRTAVNYACMVDGAEVLDSRSATEVCEWLEFVEVPHGEWAQVAIAVVMMLVSYAVTDALAPSMPMGANAQGTVGDSYSNSFTGVQNSTAPGTVIPVVYGRHRVGGHVLSISTSAATSTEIVGGVTYYYDLLRAVIAASEGPIFDIQNILVAGYPVNYYNGWKDQNKPFSYSRGYADVTEVVTSPSYKTAAKSGDITTYVPEGSSYWNTTNVSGDLSQFSVIENSNANVNNTKIQSISSEVTYIASTNEADFVDDLTTPDRPLYGGWEVELENNYGYYQANRIYFSVGGTTALHTISYTNMESGFLFIPYEELVVRFSTISDGMMSYFKKHGGMIVPTRAISEIPKQNQSSAAYDLPYVLNGEYWLKRKMVDLNKVLFNKGTTVPLDSATLDTILNRGSITKLSTTTAVTGFRVQLTAPGGLYSFSNGTYYSVQVGIGIFYKKESDTSWIYLRAENISGNSRGEINRDFASSTALPESVYEIAVVRFEDPKNDFYTVDDVRVKAVTEIISAGLGYPYTAIIGFSLRATDQLQGQVPTISTEVIGRIIKVPNKINGVWQQTNGTYQLRDSTITECDNPVWCLYDMLTNTRYGLGEYYPLDSNKVNIMLINFDYAAQYCDQSVPYVDDNGVAQTRKRFTLNLVMDESKSAFDWVDVIKTIMRASVYYSQGIFWIDIYRPRTMTQMFNMSSLTEYSQSSASYHNMPNVIEVQWPNPAIEYALDTFRVESPEYMANSSMEEVKKALVLRGVTNIDQCKSMVKYMFNKAKLIKRVTFKTATNGLRCQVNDVIGISHDTPKWGAGGRILSVVDGATVTVTVDATITPANVPDNKLYIQDYQGVMHTITAATVSATGFTYVKATNGNFVPNNSDTHKDAFSYGSALFKIASIQKDSDLMSSITAEEYSEELYALVDDTSDLSTITPINYSDIPAPYRGSVDNVTVSASFKLDNNLFRSLIDITYTKPSVTGFVSVDVHMTKVGSGVYTIILQDVKLAHIEYFSSELAEGDYQFVLTANYTNRKQSLTDAIAETSLINKGTVTITKPQSDAFLAGVRGLEIRGMANDGTFVGKDCVLVWNKPLVTDTMTEVPAGSDSGAGTVQDTNLLSHYVVTIASTGGTTRRSVKVTDPTYTYTHEANHEDGVTRTFTATVVAYDIFGRVSKPVPILCNNPSPAAIV